MFENVTYTFYSDTLGRSAVPSATEFDKYTAENILVAKTMCPFIRENQPNGLDSAVCMMIEEQYKADQNNSSDERFEISRSVEGFSQTFDVSKVSSLKSKKMYWIRLYCDVPSLS